jgi:hypothetical protein
MIHLHELLVRKSNQLKAVRIDGSVMLKLNLKKLGVLMRTEFMWVKDRGLLVADSCDMVMNFRFL